jgi:hypothetical protein
VTAYKRKEGAMHNLRTPEGNLRPFSEEEKQKLERIAPWFDVSLRAMPDGQFMLQVLDPAGARETIVSPRFLHTRMVCELCEKTIRWVFYNKEKSCAKTLLEIPEPKLQRYAELYRQWKSKGYPG